MKVYARGTWHKKGKTDKEVVDSRMEVWLKSGFTEVLGSNEFGMNIFLM